MNWFTGLCCVVPLVLSPFIVVGYAAMVRSGQISRQEEDLWL